MEVRCKVNKVHVKKGDTVIILSGKDKNKKGKVLEVSPTERKVIIEGCNMVTKHVKPRRMGEPGGIVKAEAPLYACKVMLVCPKCGKGTRVGHKVVKKTISGKEKNVAVRVCKKCGAEDI